MLLTREVKDPRVTGVTITEVEVSKDLEHAKVFVSSFLSTTEPDEIIKVLARAAPFLRSNLGKRIKARTIPNLKFIYDTTADQAARVGELLASAKIKDER